MEILRKNSELQRNIWSELSMQRMILMPSIIITVLLLILIGVDSRNVLDVLINVSYIGSGAILMLWGSKVAHDSIIDEYNERTWDWQRMNSLSSKQLLIGKLFGATAFNWYGGFICLAFWLFFSVLSAESSVLNIMISFLSVIIVSIGLMSFSMLIALLRIRKGSARNRFKSGSVIFLLILVGLSFIGQAFASVDQGGDFYNQGFTIYFFENIFYVFWALIGVNQALRYELNYKNSSKLWYIFLITAAILKGFVLAEQYDDRRNLFFFMLLAFTAQAIIYSYLLLFFESKDPIKFKLLISKIRLKDWNYLNFKAPLWTLTFPLIFIGVIFTWLAFDFSYFVSKYNLDITPVFNDLKESITKLDTFVVSISIILFVLRDFMLMFLISMTSLKKRTNGAFILYLFLLYVLFPLLVRDTHELLPLFFPFVGAGAFLCFLLPFLEVLLVVFIVRFQLKSKFNR